MTDFKFKVGDRVRFDPHADDNWLDGTIVATRRHDDFCVFVEADVDQRVWQATRRELIPVNDAPLEQRVEDLQIHDPPQGSAP